MLWYLHRVEINLLQGHPSGKKLLCQLGTIALENTLALQIYNSYENLLAPSILHTTQTIGVGNGVKYHGLILEALKNRDPQQAQAVMREHMENNLEQFKRLAAGLDQHG